MGWGGGGYFVRLTRTSSALQFWLHMAWYEKFQGAIDLRTPPCKKRRASEEWDAWPSRAAVLAFQHGAQLRGKLRLQKAVRKDLTRKRNALILRSALHTFSKRNSVSSCAYRFIVRGGLITCSCLPPTQRLRFPKTLRSARNAVTIKGYILIFKDMSGYVGI